MAATYQKLEHAANGCNYMSEQNIDSTDTNPITLSDDAQNAALTLSQQNPQFAGKPLRVYLDGKGCDGFYYGVTFDDASADDIHFRQGQIDVIIDPRTLEFVQGSIINWVDDERGRGFLVDNPKHRKFRGKFYKKKTWQDRLTSQKAESEVQN